MTEEQGGPLPYWSRVGIVARAMCKGWASTPKAVRNVLATAAELAKDIAWLFWMLVLPLFFWTAPLMLWLLKKDNDKRKRDSDEAMRRYMEQHTKLHQPKEPA